MVDEMPCQELVEVVTHYLEGALSAADRLRFESHLDECDACRNYVEQMRQTIAVVGHVAADELPDEMLQGLLAAFRGWRAASS
jgi:anti-sigma factor RsiW